MHTKRILALVAILGSATLNGDNSNIQGVTTEEVVIIPGVLIQTNQIAWAGRIVSYQNGGTTITFDEGMFTEPPIALITVQTDSYDDSVTFEPIITDRQTTSVTFRINVNDGTSITEAATDSVTASVYLFGH